MAKWKYPYKTKPYEHQSKALAESADRTTYALFMEMGTGKTKTTIDNIAYLYLKKRIDSALIVAPKSVYTVWKNEIETHLTRLDRTNLCTLGKWINQNNFKPFIN